MRTSELELISLIDSDYKLLEYVIKCGIKENDFHYELVKVYCHYAFLYTKEVNYSYRFDEYFYHVDYKDYDALEEIRLLIKAEQLDLNIDKMSYEEKKERVLPFITHVLNNRLDEDLNKKSDVSDLIAIAFILSNPNLLEYCELIGFKKEMLQIDNARLLYDLMIQMPKESLVKSLDEYFINNKVGFASVYEYSKELMELYTSYDLGKRVIYRLKKRYDNSFLLHLFNDDE